MWLTRLSLRRPVTLVMLLAVVGVLGAVSVFKLPLDFLPHMEMPFIGVQVPVKNGIPGKVEGEIAVEADSVSVHADISWLLLPIKSAIEQEIGRYLDQEFGS